MLPPEASSLGEGNEAKKWAQRMNSAAEFLSSSSTNDSVLEIQGATISFPLLSLAHESVEEDNGDLIEREQAEKHAAALLARPVTSNVRPTLHHHLFEGLAILIQSRLRAYADLVLRHKELSPGPCDKLDRLFCIAACVYGDNVKASFELDRDLLDESVDGAEAPLKLRFSVDLVVPGEPLGKESHALKASAKCSGKFIGISQAKGNSPNPSLRVELDTHELLEGMVDQAARAVALITTISSDDSTSSVPSRSPSFLAMPPPRPKRKRDSIVLFGGDASSLCAPVVSPELTSLKDLPLKVPVLRLDRQSSFSSTLTEDDDSDEDAFHSLSVDQCVNLVDSIFDDTSLDSVIFSPHAKRLRHATTG